MEMEKHRKYLRLGSKMLSESGSSEVRQGLKSSWGDAEIIIKLVPQVCMGRLNYSLDPFEFLDINLSFNFGPFALYSYIGLSDL